MNIEFSNRIKAFNDKIVNEYIDNSFKDVNVSQTFLNKEFEPYRNINFKCDMSSLSNGSGFNPDEEFFAKLGKKIWDIIHKEIPVTKDLSET